MKRIALALACAVMLAGSGCCGFGYPYWGGGGGGGCGGGYGGGYGAGYAPGGCPGGSCGAYPGAYMGGAGPTGLQSLRSTSICSIRNASCGH